MRSRPLPSSWHIKKKFDEIESPNSKLVSFAAAALRLLNGARLSADGLYSIVGLDYLIAAESNFSSTTAIRLTDLERLASNNTMGHVNARTLQDV